MCVKSLILLALIVSQFCPAMTVVAAPDQTIWFVRDGIAVDVMDEKQAWNSTAEGLTARGESSRLDAGQSVGEGDFEIFAELKIDDVERDNASLMLDAAGAIETGELIFARDRQVVVRGFFFGDRTQQVRPVRGLIESSEWFRLRVVRQAGVVTFLINDVPIWKMDYASSRPFGKLTLKPGEAKLTVRSFGVRGQTSPLDEWVPRLDRRFAVAGEAHTDVFVSGHDGYHTYRIPAIVRSNHGSLLAFAEGRKNSHHDHGDVDLVLRRSIDQGRTWLPMQLVYEEGDAAPITIGNPVPVVDRRTARVWLFFCRDNKHVLVTSSDDDGLSWRKPVDLTATLKRDQWAEWYATGPCHGIQLSSGRLLIPANHGVQGAGRSSRVHMILSDDQGATWRLGGEPDLPANENSVAELSDGRLYANMRMSGHDNSQPYCRVICWSDNAGESFGPAKIDRQLVCSICQASVLRSRGHNAEDLLLLSNPNSQRRERMTIRASRDGGRTWNQGLRIYEGSSAYSDMVPIDEDFAGLLFERDLYAAITFVRFKPSRVAREQ
jgi:sialidase-1